MSKNIKFSPKYGLNPTIPICFWCGEEKNEIAMLGELPNDEEAPKHMVLDYEPCDKCKANMKKGIALIGITENKPNDNRPEIIKGAYPTGHFAVVKPEAVHQFIDEPMASDIIKHKKAFIDDNILMSLLPEK